MKKTKNIIVICMFFIIMVLFLYSNSLAAWNFDPNNTIWEPNSTTRVTEASKLRDITNNIVKIISYIGSVLSIIVIAIIGIRYMLGSVEERAEYKKTMQPYIIGAILVFSITNILSIIISIVDSVF